MMKVLFLTNIPSPYRVDFFNELGKLCQLTVLFERTSSSERDASWKNYPTEHFTPIFLSGIQKGVANAFCPGVVGYLKKNRYDHIIVSNFTSPTGMLAISWLRLNKMPYWLESDGGFAKSGAGLTERIKTHFIRGAAGYFSTAQEHDRYYLQYGADPKRIHRYPFTSLYQKDILAAPVCAAEKTALRQKLGMSEPFVLLAVGQFIPRKGFDILIDAVAQLPDHIGCYIVGGEPPEGYLQQVRQHALSNVHFVGFQPKAALAEYYKAADLFVLPTRQDIWGLVINEAMAKGLPVITTDRCIAGLALVQEPALGAIIPVGNAEALAEAIRAALTRIGEESSQNVLRTIGNYTLEKMAERHMEILQAEA